MIFMSIRVEFWIRDSSTSAIGAWKQLFIRERRYKNLKKIWVQMEVEHRETRDQAGNCAKIQNPWKSRCHRRCHQSPQCTDNPRTYERVARDRERSTRKRNKDVETSNHIRTPPSPPPQQKSSKSDKKGEVQLKSSLILFTTKRRRHKGKRALIISILFFTNLKLLQSSSFRRIAAPAPTSADTATTSAAVSPANLFPCKKQKRKGTITVTLTPPQPSSPPRPPPPPPRREPKPVKMNSFDRLEENSNCGDESPMNRMPTPPQPAFFKSPAWKFVVQGDYVRINSSTSSRSGSPDPDEMDSDATPCADDGGDATPCHPSPLFCPIPDLNAKAESFITNFRAKLKLEKIHSLKKRDLGLSGLGPGPGPSQN
ncbi:hypothetical protein CDL12_04988 [Handroanthus impetiginosus]|uniref:Uncharacterized protein n=1 Tax=Handroanthus impetiginosus TaxID=429701 RepID=A0A2G9HXQ0_9LAMI|nr:hypothetical protein CDL12_04988 [Handroanthus impetiginosus]